MLQITELIPITVFVALILFILRELLDIVKKRAERKKAINVYKTLLSEEIRENFTTLDGLYNVIEMLLKGSEQEIKPQKYNVKTDRYDNDFVMIQLGEKSEYGFLSMRLPNFKTEQFNNHISTLVALDKELYDSLNELYKKIRFWSDLRNDAVCLLANEIEDIRNYFLGANFHHLKEEKEYNIRLLREAHIQLTNQTINFHAGKATAIDVKKYKRINQDNSVGQY
ncbi:hypothetical protein [Litorilituus sediminis]|uniref:Uncharacterized protein n=1 Tax=Litorilituus sediminis TaxID=718192 RepID=A0A4V0ZGH6_9GAMM|nr:hypothetical protein [Litorilituus sediminis]QBG37330.1 hypothetical protein EMK97_17090 [Litorilituus sediminis]